MEILASLGPSLKLSFASSAFLTFWDYCEALARLGCKTLGVLQNFQLGADGSAAFLGWGVQDQQPPAALLLSQEVMKPLLEDPA